MVEHTKAPVFYVRKWLSAEFLASNLIDPDSYVIDHNSQGSFTMLDPIIPVQDIEETNQRLGKNPYIVYYSTPSPIEDQETFFIKSEVLYLNIFSNNYSQISAITNLMIDLLDRKDMTAADVNASKTDDWINFKSFRFVKADEIYTSVQPAGRYIQELCFSYTYTRDMSTNGRFAF